LFGTPLIGASDGGLKDDNGSFGWKWHLPESQDSLLECSGPADALPSDHSFTRSELLGVLSALTFLVKFCQFFNVEIQPDFHPVLNCDNQGAGNSSSDANLEEWFTSARCYGNHDVINKIRTALQGLPFPVSFRWVKVHQTRSTRITELSIEALLNERADTLATAFHQKRTIPVTVEEFPNQSVIAHSASGPITGDLTHHLLTILPAQALAAYYQGKFNWTPATWDSIDHNATAAAIKKLSLADHRRIVQLRSGWLPTNKQVSRFMADRLASCPRCRHYSETVDHLLRCPQGGPPTHGVHK
jgi:ribonuclease HI